MRMKGHEQEVQGEPSAPECLTHEMEREKHAGLGRKDLRPQCSSTRDLASRWRVVKPKVPIRSVQ